MGGYPLRGSQYILKRSKKEKAQCHKAGIMTKQVKLDEDPTAKQKEKPGSDELRAEDFYYEGPYLVFTAAFHLKRGYCCNSDCRHCPYR